MLDEKHIQAFDSYLQGRKKSDSTRKHYKKAVEQFYEQISKQPKNITSADVEIWVNRMIKVYNRENGRNSNTLTVKFSGIKRYLKFLKSKGINDVIARIDEELLQAPTWIDTHVETMNKDKLKRLLNASKKSARDYALIQTLIVTTARISEVIRINISDIDFKQKTIHIWDEKTNQWSIRNVSNECIKAIKTYIDMYREEPIEKDPLFLNYKGKRITYQTSWYTVKRLAVTSGFTRNIHPHLIRHTCITLMAKQGMSLLEIQTHTGHKSLKALKKYSHMTHEDVKDKVIKSLTIDEIKPEVLESEEQPPQQIQQTVQMKPKQEKLSERNEYLQLLKQGFITSQEFQELISRNNDTMYQ